jgi:pimeloyl-ACP methyl ester carboxylesterase
VKHTLQAKNGQPVEAFCEKTRLSYIESGAAGPTVVLLHGWSAFKELWWSTLLALAPHAHAYAPDLPGHGDSPLLGSASMRQIAERIELFCATRGDERIVLVGHSMGGNIALELTLARSGSPSARPISRSGPPARVAWPSRASRSTST